MLIRLFRWFLGYVKFSYSGGFKEDFINDCYNSGVDLKNICLNGDDLTADTRINSKQRKNIGVINENVEHKLNVKEKKNI